MDSLPYTYDTSFPRVQFVGEGWGVPSDFQLPSIFDVRNAVARVDGVKSLLSPTTVYSRSITDNVVFAPRHHLYRTCLPALFRWSIFVHHEDVPVDIVASCIWSLKMWITILEESSDAELRELSKVGPDDPPTVVESYKCAMVFNARYKIAMHSLNPTVNKPMDAVTYLRDLLADIDINVPIEMSNYRVLFMAYAEALAHAETDDELARSILTRLIETSNAYPDDIHGLVRSKVYLARVLRRLGQGKQARKHDQWLVKWFRENPHMFPDSELRLLLIPPGSTTSPLLESLGGLSWLTSRLHTDETDHRLSQRCCHCGAREPMVTLRKCARCQHTYYCSTECQHSDWPFHKNGCRDFAVVNARNLAIAAIDPAQSTKAKDFHAYCTATFVARDQAIANALGLHRDSGRARTHMFISEVSYLPHEAGSLRHKFHVAKCGVFRISDALPEIERRMRLDPGEGIEFVQDLMVKFPDADEKCLPMLELIVCDDEKIAAELQIVSTSPSNLHQQHSYDPVWRGTVNESRSPPIDYVLSTEKDTPDTREEEDGPNTESPFDRAPHILCPAENHVQHITTPLEDRIPWLVIMGVILLIYTAGRVQYHHNT